MLNIKVILGSTREGRQGEKVAKWVINQLKDYPEIKSELLDLKQISLPFLDEEANPEYGESCLKDNRKIKLWMNKIHQADAYIILTPEYNHGYPAVLKNALDHAYTEWNKKPVSFIGYSTSQMAASRAIEQLRQVVIELQLAPIRDTVYISKVKDAFDEKGNLLNLNLNNNLEKMLEQLMWWGNALKNAKVKTSLLKEKTNFTGFVGTS